MENQILLSAGIDVGTTTTHLIISRIGIAVQGGFGTVPHAVITKKEIIYESKIYFTPLDENGNINGAKVAEIIKKEYAAAGFKNEDFDSGAVIITGESSKKENAKQVLADIAEYSGNFIAAQAGSAKMPEIRVFFCNGGKVLWQIILIHLLHALRQDCKSGELEADTEQAATLIFVRRTQRQMMPL
jgi:ethanolamine utilization protein EutA (predicted chaperonin)